MNEREERIMSKQVALDAKLDTCIQKVKHAISTSGMGSNGYEHNRTTGGLFKTATGGLFGSEDKTLDDGLFNTRESETTDDVFGNKDKTTTDGLFGC